MGLRVLTFVVIECEVIFQVEKSKFFSVISNLGKITKNFEIIFSTSTFSSDQYKPIQILVEVFLQQMHDPFYRSILSNFLLSKGT